MKNNIILIIILGCLTFSLYAQEEKTYWNNGKVKRITNHNESGEKTGYWKSYHESGELKESGYYESGKKSGTWYEYYYNGTRKKMNSHHNGLIKEKNTYYETGDLMISGRFDDNEKRDGRWKQYYNNWQGKLEGDYVHGKKDGEWSYYTENGSLNKVEIFRDGVRISKWEGNDVTRNYFGVENAVEAVSEKVEEVTTEAVEETRGYYGKRRNGQWKFYNKSGDVIEKGNYKNNNKDGEWTSYYDNGQIKKAQLFNDGKLLEVVSHFNQKGKVLDKGTLKKGSGTVKEYDVSNKLISTIEYVFGEKVDWNNSDQLNNLAWDIYENETEVEVLKSGIKLVKRSIELEKNYYNTDTYAALLFKTGKNKQALIHAKEAVKIAKRNKDSFDSTTELIEKINQKLKK